MAPMSKISPAVNAFHSFQTIPAREIAMPAKVSSALVV
jgi:hypothetical protein